MSKKRFFLVIVSFLFASISQPWVLADNAPAHQVQQTRPIELGSSGGNIDDISKRYCCSGTLGALVEDSQFQYILSNNHVLARSNMATLGEQITQPGLVDNQCIQDTADVVAALSDFIPIQFKKGQQIPDNVVDAAIAQVVSGDVDTSGAILDIGPVNSETVPAVPGQAVKKSGRTTGLTTGTVYAIDVTADVGYSSECGGAATNTAHFVNQIMITPGNFSAGGDSGSLIVEDVDVNPRPVGLLFAGSSSYTIANPIDAVLMALGVRMPGGSVPISPTGTIAGTVTNNQDSSSVVAAEVTVDSGQLAVTNNSGDYVISEVPVGGHSVIVSATGFKSQTQTATVNENQQTIVNFALAPQKGKGKPSSRAIFEPAIQAKRRYEKSIFHLPNVVGMGVALGQTNRPVIEVYLKEDSPQTRRQIPAALDNIPVRVVVTGEFIAF